MLWWNDPTSKDVFILSWVGVVLESCAAATGLILFMVRIVVAVKNTVRRSIVGVSHHHHLALTLQSSLLYQISGSALCLVFALENCIDFLSSVVVLWRFYCPGEMTKEREELLQKRETRANMAISFVLVLLGIAVFSAAAKDIVDGEETNSDSDLDVTITIIALISVVIFGVMSFIKLHFANKLNSASLQKDAFCSMIGTLLAIGILVTNLVIQKASSSWWLDPVFAFLCGSVALLLGLHAVIVASCIEKIPIFSVHWWLVSQGYGMDETTGQETEPLEDFGDQRDLTFEVTDSEAMKDATKLSEMV
jgi:hypothetical protein